MNKKILAVLTFLSLAIGYVPLASADIAGNAVPVITQSFASKEIWPGQTWMIYLNASDPNGEMKYIYATVEAPGVGQYPLTMIRVAKGDRKDLSGYLYLPTGMSTHTFPLYYVNLTLTVQVKDRSGQLSKPVVFELAMNNRASQAAPPEGVFKDHELGPIPVILHTPGGDDGRSMP